MTEQEYRALPAINASAISAGMVSMLAMRHVMTGGAKDDTPAMAWGRKVHAAILEPDRFFGSLALWEGGRKYGKTWDAFTEENPDGDLIVTRDELVDLTALSRAVWACKPAAALLTGGECEKVLTWTDKDCGACKGRVDMGRGGVTLTDLKTTATIIPAAFWKTAERLAYHVKMGWYARGVELVTGTRPRVAIIVLEAKPPHDCYVAEMDAGIVAQGEEQAVEIAHRYRVHEAVNSFPGVVPEGTIQYERAAWAIGGGDEVQIDMEGASNE